MLITSCSSCISAISLMQANHIAKQVLSLLLGCCEAEEECGHVVAECLGHLALLAPAAVLPSLQVCVHCWVIQAHLRLHF